MNAKKWAEKNRPPSVPWDEKTDEQKREYDEFSRKYARRTAGKLGDNVIVRMFYATRKHGSAMRDTDRCRGGSTDVLRTAKIATGA